QQITRHFTDSCCPAESGTYLGAPLIIVMVVITARLWRDALVRWSALTALAMALLSMGPHLHIDGVVTPVRLPFSVFANVPVIANMLAARLMLYVYLAAAILVA